MTWSASGIESAVYLKHTATNDTVIDLVVGSSDFGASLYWGTKAFEVLGVRFEITSTATVGNRRPVISVLDGSSDVVWATNAATVLPAGASAVYCFDPGLVQTTSAGELPGGIARCQFPMHLILPAGFTLRFADENDIDTDLDDFVIHVRGRLVSPGSH